MDKKLRDPVLEKRCEITGEMISGHDAVKISDLRPAIREQLVASNPGAKMDGYVGQVALNKVRLDRIQKMLIEDRGEVTAIDKEVLESIETGRVFAHDPFKEAPEKITFGDRLSDKMASFGGSWSFIILFFIILAIWIVMNLGLLVIKPFDPFPFILMNLILSCIAAIQAPVIMMSQNRQERKDRTRSEHDYQINLKAELEIRALHEKIDRLIGHQWQQLLEVQQMQMDMMQELQSPKK